MKASILTRAPRWFQRFVVNLAKAYHPRYSEASAAAKGWPVGSGQDLEGNIKSLRHVVWAYICISKITRSVAGLPLKFYEGYDKKNRRQITEGDVVDLMYRPNSEDTHRELFMDSVGFLYGTGTVYWALDQVSQLTGRPVWGKTTLWTLPSHRVEIIPAVGIPGRRIERYEVTADGGKKISYQPNEISQFKLFNLENQYNGLAPLTVGMKLMEADYYARRHNLLFFKHGASPGLHLKSAQRYDEAAEKRIIESFQARHQGVESFHQILISWSGLEPVDEKRGPKDIDFVNLIKLTREEIIALFGIPPAEVGLFEYANYANALIQKKQYWLETIVPILQLFETRCNEHEFPRWTDREIWFEFDLSGVEALRENRAEKAKTVVALHDSGLFTANELRSEYYNAEAVLGGDELKKPAASGGMLSAGIFRSKAFDDKSDEWFRKDIDRRKHERKFLDEMKKYFAGQRTRVLERLAAYPEDYSISVSDVDSLVLEIEEQVILENQTKTLFEEGVADAGRSALNEVKPKKAIKQMTDIVGDFDVTDPLVIAWIEKKIATFVVRVGSSTKMKIRGLVDEAYEGGWTLKRLAGELSDINRSIFSDVRALRIAQTEMGGAMNAGSLMGYRQSGVVDGKLWLSARDGHARPSHQEADALSPVGLEEKFSNGLDFPGDPAGPPEEIVNCRCDIGPYIKEPE